MSLIVYQSSNRQVLLNPCNAKSGYKGGKSENKKGAQASDYDSDLTFLDCEVPDEIIFLDPHGGNTFYSQVNFCGICVKLGEFVKANLESSEPDEVTTAVCQVLAIFDDVEGGLGVLMEVRWFVRVSELSEKRRKTYVHSSVHNPSRNLFIVHHYSLLSDVCFYVS